MNFSLFSRVILTEDFPDENLVAGDMGVVVEHHPTTPDYPAGYEVEFFAGNGETLAVISIAASMLRVTTREDILHVRQTFAIAS